VLLRRCDGRHEGTLSRAMPPIPRASQRKLQADVSKRYARTITKEDSRLTQGECHGRGQFGRYQEL
jgi:hypothetical protein